MGGFGDQFQTNAARQEDATTLAGLILQKARALRDAGLSRVTISLDTLDAQTFSQITGGGNIAHILSGIEAAQLYP